MTNKKQLELLVSLIEKYSTVKLSCRLTLGGDTIPGRKRYAIIAQNKLLGEGDDIRKILDEIGSK